MNYDLQEIAAAARLRAYAPYSNFLVGAALLSVSGRIFAGCNVENVSLGLTLCAERVCVGMAVAQEERHFKTITIVADSRVPIVPCGACRQVLAEFAPRLRIVTWTLAGVRAEFMLQELLPFPKHGILE
ncbi:MAG TPA: cytidine deaminase [Chthoniobacterales bacterium]